MASYAELATLSNDAALITKVRVACIIAANAIRNDANASEHKKAWARSTFSDGGENYRTVLWAVLAINKDATVATIQAATDAQIQSAVDTALAMYL